MVIIHYREFRRERLGIETNCELKKRMISNIIKYYRHANKEKIGINMLNPETRQRANGKNKTTILRKT